jgi:Major Facilitator Superfamily
VSVSVLAPKRRLSPPLDFVLVSGIIALALFASATPSPLYADYAASWHFSTPVLTAVYAVYAIGVLASLLLIGRLSDEIGRRPVLIGALVALLLATGLYMVAQSVVWLFAARAVQGLATGAALGAAGAAMLDLHPRGDAVQVGLVNGVGSALGIGFGAAVRRCSSRRRPIRASRPSCSCSYSSRPRWRGRWRCASRCRGPSGRACDRSGHRCRARSGRRSCWPASA